MAQTLQDALNPAYREDEWKTPRTVSADVQNPLGPQPSQPYDVVVCFTRAVFLFLSWVARTILTGGTGG